MAQVISSKNSNCDAEMVRVEVDAGSDTALEGGPRPGIGDGGELNGLPAIGLAFIRMK